MMVEQMPNTRRMPVESDLIEEFDSLAAVAIQQTDREMAHCTAVSYFYTPNLQGRPPYCQSVTFQYGKGLKSINSDQHCEKYLLSNLPKDRKIKFIILWTKLDPCKDCCEFICEFGKRKRFTKVQFIIAFSTEYCNFSETRHNFQSSDNICVFNMTVRTISCT
jgi:hypothetical protein